MKHNSKTTLSVYSLLHFPFFYYLILYYHGMGDFFSLIVAGITGYYMFKVRRVIGDKRQRSGWTFLGLACFSWFLSELLQMLLLSISGIDAQESVLIDLLYVGTHFFLLLGVAYYTIQSFKQWYIVQLLVDGMAVILCVALLLWILLFDRSIEWMLLTLERGFPIYIGILIDILLFTLASLWYLSIRKGKILLFNRCIMAGITLYSIMDILSHKLYLGGVYPSGPFIVGGYMGTFVLFFIGGFIRLNGKEHSKEEGNNCSNLGMDNKIYLILLCPILITVIKGFSIDVLYFLLIVIVYKYVNTYIQLAAKNEELLKMEQGLKNRLEEMVKERTAEIIKQNRVLDNLIKKDAATDTYNKNYFMEILEEQIQWIQNDRSPEIIAIVFIDLDKFKSINDIYGHRIGDQVIKKIANRLKKIQCMDSVLSRFGGDEFIMMVKGKYRREELQVLLDHILNIISTPLDVGHYSFRITGSLGVSIYPKDGDQPEDLIYKADIAMYQAKKKGKNKAMFFQNMMSEQLKRMGEIEYYLQKADLDREFQVYYQPQYHIETQEFVGMEALLRWRNPSLGDIPPLEFIPVAEEFDLIIKIGNWVTEQAIKQISRWNHRYQTHLRMGINVSPKQLYQENLVQNVQKYAEKYSVKPSWIDIEITENIPINDIDRVISVTNDFKGKGFHISIDDFGMGYFSLNYLKRISFHRLKIAKPLVDNITEIHEDYQIIQFIIQLARTMGARTIAEGVETKEQLELLKDLGCDEIQGFYLGEPIPVAQFEKLIQQQYSSKKKRLAL